MFAKILILIILFEFNCIKLNGLLSNEKCVENELKEFTGECIWYQKCTEGKFKPYKCPSSITGNIDGEYNITSKMFDPFKKKCVHKEPLKVEGKCNEYMECTIFDSISHIEKWKFSKCPSSFHFDHVAKKCIESNRSSCVSKVCDDSLCLNGGICEEDIDDNYKCNCSIGFTGKNCEIKDICNDTSCLNGGMCFSNNEKNKVCICKDRFSGDRCEIDNSKNDKCWDNQCENGATPISYGDSCLCSCLPGYSGNKCQIFKASNCYDIYKLGIREDGIYEIYPNQSRRNGSVLVYCELQKGGWTRIMNKVDTLESTFHRGWFDYENGFGTPEISNWIGLKNMFYLTNMQLMSLRVEVFDETVDMYTNEYDLFQLGPRRDRYRLKLGKIINGNFGQDFGNLSNNMQFYTYDKDYAGCSGKNNGGWWWYSNDCYKVCLTCQSSSKGQLYSPSVWSKYAKMLIRPLEK